MDRTRFGLLALVMITASSLMGCAALPRGGCGPACGCDIGCAVEPGCDCVEPDCGCEPSCGCGGRGMALQKWAGGCDCRGPRINVCTGPDCGCEPSCGCGEVTCGVEPGCGCEPECGCEPGCGCEPDCGCASGCCGGCGGGCLAGCGHGLLFGFKCVCNEFRWLTRPLIGGCGCGGCDGECYWSEWHNDPPRCCDPCDDCGNWVGPTAGYQAPYDHEFAPRRTASKEGLLPKLH